MQRRDLFLFFTLSSHQKHLADKNRHILFFDFEESLWRGERGLERRREERGQALYAMPKKIPA